MTLLSGSNALCLSAFSELILFLLRVRQTFSCSQPFLSAFSETILFLLQIRQTHSLSAAFSLDRTA